MGQPGSLGAASIIFSMIAIATAALFAELAVLGPQRRAEQEARFAEALAAEEARARAKAFASDRCDPEIAMHNIRFVSGRTGGLISWDITDRARPIVIMPIPLWRDMGEQAQLGMVAAFDCALAGRGNHVASVTVVPARGAKAFALFDPVELARERQVGYESIQRRFE